MSLPSRRLGATLNIVESKPVICGAQDKREPEACFKAKYVLRSYEMFVRELKGLPQNVVFS